jgi:hypothetical protein
MDSVPVCGRKARRFHRDQREYQPWEARGFMLESRNIGEMVDNATIGDG